jgi:hypothetical protein
VAPTAPSDAYGPDEAVQADLSAAQHSRPAAGDDPARGGSSPVPARAIARRGVPLAAAVAVLIAALGVPLGYLWSLIGPRVPIVMSDQGPLYAAPEQEQMIGGEAWYVIITGVAGILFAVLAWYLLRRVRGAVQLLGLAAGAIGSGVLSAWFGRQLGRAQFLWLLKHAAPGRTFQAPVVLRVAKVGLWHGFLPYARGDVLTMAFAAIITYLVLAFLATSSSLRSSVRPAAHSELGQRDRDGSDLA